MEPAVERPPELGASLERPPVWNYINLESPHNLMPKQPNSSGGGRGSGSGAAAGSPDPSLPPDCPPYAEKPPGTEQDRLLVKMVRDAVASVAAACPYTFQQQNCWNQIEHLSMLLANITLRLERPWEDNAQAIVEALRDETFGTSLSRPPSFSLCHLLLPRYFFGVLRLQNNKCLFARPRPHTDSPPLNPRGTLLQPCRAVQAVVHGDGD